MLTADGGTRCASITGAYVALGLACDALRARGVLALAADRLRGRRVGGIVDGAPLLDLDYARTRAPRSTPACDRRWRTHRGPGHRRRTPLSRANLDALLALAAKGVVKLQAAQERRWPRRREAHPRHPQPAPGCASALLDGYEVAHCPTT